MQIYNVLASSSDDFQKRGMTVPESQPLPQSITVPEVQERSTVRYIHQLRRNPADGPSRRPDYEIGYETYCTTFSNLAAVEPYVFLPAIMTAQATDILATDVNKKIFDSPMVGYSGLTER
jgi:hypothetical protein